MATQTGSIDLKATGGFKTYADAQFATSEQVTTLNTAIEQNASDILLRATKTEAAQMAQPNLSPYFSSSPYNRTDNSYWYAMGVNSNYTFTDMGDGWMRVQCTNSGSSVIRVDWYPIKCPSVVAGQPYTWLAEVRNNASTSASSGSDFYLVQNNNCQFWGQKAIETIEGPGGKSMSINIGTCGSSYVLQKVQNAETASDGHWTNNDEASVVGLACWTFRCAANSSIDYEVRLSLYEGRYEGPYKPYVGSQLYASQAELKVANDAISLRATKDEVEKTYSTKEDSQLDRAGSGTSVTVEGAANAALKGLHVLGESVQDGTPTPDAPIPISSVSGVNLLDMSEIKIGEGTTWFGLTFTVEDDGWIAVSGATTKTAASILILWGATNELTFPAGDYAISAEVEGFEFSTNYRIQAYYNNGSSAYINGASHITTFTASIGVNRICLYVASSATGIGINGRFRLRLSHLSCMPSWIPSGNLGLLTRGKNLLDPKYMYNTVTTNGVTVNKNADGSFSMSGTCTKSGDISVLTVAYAFGGFMPLRNGETYVFKATTNTPNSSVRMILRANNKETGTGVKYFNSYGDSSDSYAVTADDIVLSALYFNVPNGTVTDGMVFYPQLELGSEATEYEPYNGTVTPIPLNGHELRSLPDGTRDELTVDVDGHVTMTQRVGSVTLDGSSDEVWADESTTTSGKPSHVVTVADLIDGSPLVADDGGTVYGFLVCNRFPEGSDSGTSTGTYRGITGVNVRRSSAHQLTFYLNGESLSEFKTWLASNDTTVIYPLATPQTIDLGTIDMPQVHDGDTVEVIAALTPSIDATWWASAGQAVADAYASLSSAIEVRAESIVSTVSERYATSQEVQAISSQIEQTAQSWTAQFNELTGGADLSMTLAEAFDALGVTSANLEQIRSFVRITTDSNGDPLLLMGSATSPIMLALSNDSLRFMHGSDPVAYIDVDGTTNEGRLHITRAVVVKELQFGSWKWFERDNGNMALKWVGDE